MRIKARDIESTTEYNERALKHKPSAISQMCLFNVNACLGNENALLIIM